VADERSPFADVLSLPGGDFSIPDLKWRELLFIGALRADGDTFVRDPARPLPPFQRDDLFPMGRAFRITREGGRVLVHPVDNAD
jgi:hypothetical protein